MARKHLLKTTIMSWTENGWKTTAWGCQCCNLIMANPEKMDKHALECWAVKQGLAFYHYQMYHNPDSNYRDVLRDAIEMINKEIGQPVLTKIRIPRDPYTLRNKNEL